MNVEIENYRGWTISFNTELESFYCHSDQHDIDENKKSYASTKKWIDDFIKDNEVFKPIWVEGKPETGYYGSKFKIIGIRKDGRFIWEDSKGEKKQLSEYDEKSIAILNEENEKHMDEVAKINGQIAALELERKAVYAKFRGLSLVDYKKQLYGKE